MDRDAIIRQLYEQQDTVYADFQRKLCPTLPPEVFIGVRTPALRAMAKALAADPDIDRFLNQRPHPYFEENQLHAFILSLDRSFKHALAGVEAFLPDVDNWMTCDQLSPKIFRRHRAELLAPIQRWLRSDQVYTVRFGIGMLMEHFLDGAFDPAYPAMVAAVRSEAYYTNMMAAWYFATALAKQYEVVLPFIEQQKMAPWTHNKAIQKAIESRRITPEQKAYLRTLKV